MRILFDLESDGLLDKVTQIWCICGVDIDTLKKYEWTFEDPWNGVLVPHWIMDAEELIGHNIIDYDLKVFKKIWNWSPDKDVKITDTLVMSRLANPDRTKPVDYPGKGGPNSLEAWGYRVGKGKLENEVWDIYHPNILRRCRQDVEINLLAYHQISSELEGFSEDSIQLEHDIARIMSDQEHYGIYFDVVKAQEYIADLDDRIAKIDNELLPRLPKTVEQVGVSILNPFLKNGDYRKNVKEYLANEYRESDVQLIGGPFSRIRILDFDLNSVQRVKEYLLAHGWEPDEWNYSSTTGERSSPKLEGEFYGVTGDVPRLVKERITWRHRRSQIEGWLSNVRADGSIPAGANPCGTNTGRMRHRTIVNIPKANSDKKTGQLIWDTTLQKDIYGTQMRSLFIPRPGFVLVGHDASGLELRMLAHYLDDKEFTQEILNGDIHTYNQIRAGLPTRDAAKTFIYALIYGAGDRKIGSIVGGDETDGAQIKSEYFGALPRLAKFIDSVKRASGKGWLKGLDGRRVYMRKDSSGRIARSKAANTLLQSAGAIVMKRSCITLWDNVKLAQIKAQKVLDMHDEGQSEVWNSPEHLEPYCELAVNSIVQAGEYFKLNIPLAAEYKIGNNMAETH